MFKSSLCIYAACLQMMRKKMVKTAEEVMSQRGTKSQVFGRMQAVFIEMDDTQNVSTFLVVLLLNLLGLVMASKHWH